MTIPVTPTFIEQLQDNITKSSPDLDLSAIGLSPPLSAPVLRMSVVEGTPIPSSLITALDAAYLFHLLARDPQKVVAPGKSLLSVLSGLDQTATRPMESASEESVRKVALRVFWDQVILWLHALLGSLYAYLVAPCQALEALSSPLPSSQISRLKGLYKDLHEALTPLFPSKHPILVTFSLPLPPTSSPLLSAINHLRDALLALRQRCAPVRDVTIDDILHKLHHRLPSATEDMAELLLDVIRSVLELSIDMRNDYSTAVLATASEQELLDIVAMMAENQEQTLILRFWGSKEAVRKAWIRWMKGFRPANPVPQVLPKRLWILKLIESLGKPHAVTSKLMEPLRLHEMTNGTDIGSKPVPEAPNMLPPQFLFSGPTLLRLQNFIQALTIAASLKSLVSTPRTASPPLQPGAGDLTAPVGWTFTERIWALLEPEIEKTNDVSSDTKIINLADEVVMTHMGVLPPGVTRLDANLEQRLRSTVDRILRTDDPVFTLLQKRLLVALSDALLDVSTAEEPTPVRMQSGRRLQHQTRVSSSPIPVQQSVRREVTIAVKGFEDPIIAKQCSIAASGLKKCVEWVERVWGDTIMP